MLQEGRRCRSHVSSTSDERRGLLVIAERAGDTSLDDLDSAAMREALPSLLSTLDAIRHADVSDTSGFGLGIGHTAPYARWRDALLDIAREHDRVPGGGIGSPLLAWAWAP